MQEMYVGFESPYLTCMSTCQHNTYPI